MSVAVTVIGAVSQTDKVIWRGQNFLRRSAESIEWNLRQLANSQDLGVQGIPAWLEAVLIWLVRGLAFLLLAILAWVLLRQLWTAWKRWRSRSDSPAVIREQGGEPTLTVAGWLATAQQAQAQQDYAAACRALYMALLLQLETTGWLPQDPARTDQEFLRTLDAHWALSDRSMTLPQAWRQIVHIHESSFYGAEPVVAETFEQCQQAYQRVAPELRQDPSGAAK